MATNTYLVKAIDAYPYNLEECVEALGYALAFDEEHPIAHCLMGRMQMEYFMDFERALLHFEDALKCDVYYAETYYHYLDCLLKLREYQKAQKFLEFARSQKTVSQFALCEFEVRLLESQLLFKDALELVNKAKLYATNGNEVDSIETHQKRLEMKQKLNANPKNASKGNKKKGK